MKNFLILILTGLVLAGLVACSEGDQSGKTEGLDASVADQPDKPEELAAGKTAELMSETGAETSVEENLEMCRAATKKLGGSLRSALQGAMGEGGPLGALNVCHDEAEAIAEQICQEEGLVVGRTSEKYRNPANAPDAWEKAGLEAFNARIAAGENPQDLEMWTTVTEADGGRTFRYLKGIPTAPACLKCHGGEVAPELAAELADLYPRDKAIGFDVGDMRGAFTVKIELPRS